MGHDILTSSFLNLRSKLHHIALKYLSNDEDAKDALQDTWLKLKSKGNISDDNEAKNKLVCALRNVCIDKLRKAKMQSIEDSRTSKLLYYTMETEDIKNLENLLSKGLSPLQQQIFNLVTHEGYDYELIAEELSMSVEAVRMNMSRARKKIREHYKRLNK
mgnify:FL=1